MTGQVWLGGVIGQGVGYFVAHDLGEFIVRQVQLLEQAGVHRHAATCHTPGVHRLGTIDRLEQQVGDQAVAV